MVDKNIEEKTSELLFQLSGVLAHEIRNPLTGISTTVQLLKDKLDNAPTANYVKYCDVVLEELERINTIVSDLVDFARPYKLQTMKMDVREILDRVILLVEAEAGNRGVIIERCFPAEPFEIECEPNRFRQAFLNILKNALEAIEKNGRITVSLVQNEVDARLVRSIMFQDSGPGISDEALSKVFLPFFTTKTRGMGLGLPITKKIIEEHGGKIEVGRMTTGGTAFTLNFPVTD